MIKKGDHSIFCTAGKAGLKLTAGQWAMFGQIRICFNKRLVGRSFSLVIVFYLVTFVKDTMDHFSQICLVSTQTYPLHRLQCEIVQDNSIFDIGNFLSDLGEIQWTQLIC